MTNRVGVAGLTRPSAWVCEDGRMSLAVRRGAAAEDGNGAAAEKARRDHERALPHGLDTPGHLIFRLMVGSQAMGWLWLAIPGPEGDPGMAWVYTVEVDKAFRGRGYGR